MALPKIVQDINNRVSFVEAQTLTDAEKTQARSNIGAPSSADLIGKADTNLSNAVPAQSFKTASIEWGLPDYSGRIDLPTAASVEQTYTAPSKGYIGYLLRTYGTDADGYIKVNGVSVVTCAPAGAAINDCVSGVIPVDQGDVIKYFSNQNPGRGNNFQFYPCKGV